MPPRTLKSNVTKQGEFRLVQAGPVFTALLIKGDKVVRTVVADDADQAWTQLHDEAPKTEPEYAGYVDAIRRFRSFFPGGFSDPAFGRQERDYKVLAKAHLDASAPLAEAAAGEGDIDEVVKVFCSDTNLLSQFEKPRIRKVLLGYHGRAFLTAAARFALDPGPATLGAMAALLKPEKADKWTIVTYLPFLWLPERHMFLKPETMKDFAGRVGHGFARTYRAALDFEVYESLLALVAETEREVQALEPRDRIDIQSFMWVVGAYGEDGAAKLAAVRTGT